MVIVEDTPKISMRTFQKSPADRKLIKLRKAEYKRLEKAKNEQKR